MTALRIYSRSTGMAAVWAMAMMLAPLPVLASDAAQRLAAFHESLIERYPGVAHLSADDLAAMADEEVVLFDVRKESEYAVSRIEGAIRVPPSITAGEFLADHAPVIAGKQVVFYCSVGERSSRLAERVRARLGANTVAGVHNLEGGIFNWHNEYRNVVSSDGQTDAIHPFNRRWGRLLERSDAIRMTPER